MLKRADIRIRDPFIVPDKEKGCYYMYGTTALDNNAISAGCSYSMYKTADLENFEEPVVVFNAKDTNFWGTKDFWAPEVHIYKGKYYLFGSAKAEGKCRGTHIFVSEKPEGPFVPVSDRPATPLDWECLDGTLWVEDGVPYMVFCHEWVQIGDGTVCAVRLTDDLSAPVGEPFELFKASDAGVTTVRNGSGNYVTDGPFLYTDGGRLCMIWSSFIEGRYAVLDAKSDGGLRGKWSHFGSRFDFNGGHAMLFDDLEGRRMISLHGPNTPMLERAMFIEIK